MVSLKQHQTFFQSGKTHSLLWRKKQLRKLLKALKKYENHLQEALLSDFYDDQRSMISLDIKYVEQFIRHTLKNLSTWVKPKRNRRTLSLVRRTSYTTYEPYGTVLIISPTHRPVLSVFEPLINAIAAGNTAVVHLSGWSKMTGEVIFELITSEFPLSYITVFIEDRNTALISLKEEVDFIYFRRNEASGDRNKIAAFSDKKTITGLF